MSHTYTNIYVHLVWGTKHRESQISDRHKIRMHKYIRAIIDSLGSKTIAIGGMPDHIHILVSLAPKLSISKVVQKVKVHSTLFYNKELCLEGQFSWQEGYGAFSVSESVVKKVITYIDNQEEHHKKGSFRDEFIALLKRHKIRLR